jgi:serine/threonine protein kinase
MCSIESEVVNDDDRSPKLRQAEFQVKPLFTQMGQRRRLSRQDVKFILGDSLEEGQGGTSRVYRSQCSLDALYPRLALRQCGIVPTDNLIIKESELRQAFEAERAALELCNSRSHPNIMILLASFESDYVGFLLLPAALTDLATFWRWNIDEQKNILGRVDLTRWFVRQLANVADAVLTLQTKLTSSLDEKLLCIHGDIKASNILLFQSTNDCQGATLRLADFGSSQLIVETDDLTEIPTEGLSGTYASPESALATTVSTTTDIWGLGVLFLETMVWLRHGSTGLEAFSDFRMRRSYPYGMNLNSDHFFKLEPSSPDETANDPWIDELNPAVSVQLSDLRSGLKNSALEMKILDLIEQRMMLVQSHARISIQELCTDLQNL